MDVDDTKILHFNPNVVSSVIEQIEAQLGKIAVPWDEHYVQRERHRRNQNE